MILYLFFLNILSYLAFDIHLPAFPEIIDEWLVDDALVKQLISIAALVGTVVSPIWGALVDRYRPRRVIIASFIISIIGHILGACSSNIYQLLAARVVQFVGVGAVTSFSMFMIFHRYKRQDLRARLLAILEVIIPIAFFTAPLFGAKILELNWWDLGWRNNFLLIAVLQLLGLVAGFFVKLDYKESEEVESIKDIILKFPILCRNKTFLYASLIIGFGELLWMVFGANSSIFYMTGFNLDAEKYSYYFSSTSAGYFLGAVIYQFIIRRHDVHKIFYAGVIGYTMTIPILLGFLFHIIQLNELTLTLMMVYANFTSAFFYSGIWVIGLEKIDIKYIGIGSTIMSLIAHLLSGIAMTFLNDVIDDTEFGMFFIISVLSIIMLCVFTMLLKKTLKRKYR